MKVSFLSKTVAGLSNLHRVLLAALALLLFVGNAYCQTPAHDHLVSARKFALFAAGGITSPNDPVIAHGYAGSDISVDPAITAPHHLVLPDSNCSGGNIAGIISNEGPFNTFGSNINPLTSNEIGNQEPWDHGGGILFGSATFNDPLTFSGDPEAGYFVYIEGNLNIGANALMELGDVLPQNIMVYVTGNITIEGGPTLHGIFVAKGSITVDGAYTGKTSLLAGNLITIDSTAEAHHFYSPYYLTGQDVHMLNGAATYALLAGMDITASMPIRAQYRAGAGESVSDSVTAPLNQVYTGTQEVTDALLSLDSVKTEMYCLTGTSLMDLSTASTPGVYTTTDTLEFYDELVLNGDSNSVYIFNILNSFTFHDNATIKLGQVKPEHIYWNIAGDLTIGDNAAFYGITLVGGHIYKTGVNYGEASLLSMQDIVLDSLSSTVGHNTFFAPLNFPQAIPPVSPLTVTSTVTDTTLTVYWEGGKGDNVLIMMQDAPVTAEPQHGNYYAADTVYKSGYVFADSSYVVYNGSRQQGSVTITGLNPLTMYQLKVYSSGGYGNATIYASKATVKTKTTGAPYSVTGAVCYMPVNIKSFSTAASAKLGNMPKACGELMEYVPGPNDPIKTVKLVFHVFRDDNGNGNWGPGLSGKENELRGLVGGFTYGPNNTYHHGLNDVFANIPQHVGPGGATLPNAYVQDSRIRFSLEQVYFHNDYNAWNQSPKNRKAKLIADMYNEYVVNTNLSDEIKNEMLHVFFSEIPPMPGEPLVPYPVTSTNPCAFQAYPEQLKAGGLADFHGKALQMKGHYYEMYSHPYTGQNGTCNGTPGYIHERTLKLLGHELGHNFSLEHVFDSNLTCSKQGYNDLPANIVDHTTNNMMDYNFENALSACQIGQMHRTLMLSAPGADLPTLILAERPYVSQTLKKDFCTYDAAKTITITKNTTWSKPVNLQSDLYIQSGYTLTLKCRLGFAANSGTTIIIENGGKLVLDGASLGLGATSMLDCTGSATILIGGNPAVNSNNTGLVEIRGKGIVVGQGLNLQLQERASLYIAPGADINFEGGSLTTESGSFVCIDLAAKLRSTQGGLLTIKPGTNTFLNPAVPSPPAGACLTNGCHLYTAAISSSVPGNALCQGSSITLNAAVNTNSTFTYSWLENGVSAGTSASITKSPAVNTTYSVTVTDLGSGCTYQSSVIITVKPLTVISAGSNFTVSPNTIEIILDNIPGITPPGNSPHTWSGPHVSQIPGLGYVFKPWEAALASLTSATLTYNITQENGCISTASVTINLSNTPVSPAPLIFAGADQTVCSDMHGYFDLLTIPGLNPLSGIWSGMAPINSNRYFDVQTASTTIPGTAASKDYVLTYSYTVGGITYSDNITVTVYRPDAFVSPYFTSVAKCVTNPKFTLPLVNLHNYVSVPVTWAMPPGSPPAITLNSNTGPNQSKYDFDPSVAGPGLFHLTYTFTNPVSGCTKSADYMVSVSPNTADAGPDFTVCESGGNLTLTGASPAGGVWSGNPGISSSGVFKPSYAGNAGIYSLTYTVTNTCGTFTDTRRVTVSPGQGADAGSDQTYCVTPVYPGDPNTNLIELIGLPANGTWASPGLSTAVLSTAGVFDIAAVPPGTYTLTYTKTGLCDPDDEVEITVLPSALTVNMPLTYTSCDGPLVLNGLGNGTGGAWEGPGVTFNPISGEYTFNPNQLAPGKDYVLYYSASPPPNSGQCTDAIMITVTVNCCDYTNIYQQTGGNYNNPLANQPDHDLGMAGSLTTIDANNYPNKTVTFSGIYHVKGHVKFTSSVGTGIFILTPGTKFIVDAAAGFNQSTCGYGSAGLTRIIAENAQLALDGAILQASCDAMWGGIWIKNGSELLAYNKATVQDAEIGALIQDCNPNALTSAVYLLEDAVFRNNGAGLMSFNLASPPLPVIYGIKFSTFEMDWSTVRTLAGLSKFTNEGVHMEGMIVSNNYYDQYPVEGNTFKNLGTGVNSFLAPNAEIRGNEFKENWVADIVAFANAGQPCIVADNIIEVSRKPDATDSPYPELWVHTGIEAEEGAVLSGNTITKVNGSVTGVADGGWTGIGLTNRWGNGGHGVRVEADNLVTGFTEGVRVEIRKLSNTIVGYIEPVILGNSFVNNAIGVRVMESTGTITGTHTPPTLYISCNTFSQTQPTGRVYTTDAYGIYGDEDALFVINNPNAVPAGGATMKNNFTGTPPGNNAFIHVFNDLNNTALTYRPFRPGPNMQDTHLNTLVTGGNVTKLTNGIIFSSSVNCKNLDNYDYGVQTRLANTTKPAPSETQKVVDYLEQNYPNPFATETNIRYALPEGKEQGSLVIRDIITGKVMLRQELKAKAGTATLRINNLAAGIYVYSLEANGELIASKKMVILQR